MQPSDKSERAAHDAEEEGHVLGPGVQNMKSTCLLAAILISCIPIASAQNEEHASPQGTEVKVGTDTVILAKPPANQQYTATVSDGLIRRASGRRRRCRGTGIQRQEKGVVGGDRADPTRTPSENSNEEEI
jgi:hypothetical protein